MDNINLNIESQKNINDYKRFSLITLFVLLVSLLFYTIFSYHKFKQNNHKILAIESRNIATAIVDSFNYVNLLNINIAKEIAKEITNKNNNNLKNILAIFKKNQNINDKNKDFFSWSSYDFVDKNNFQLVNSKIGIRKIPPNMSNRKYSTLCKKNLWQLQLSTPTYGNPSGVWTIPAGTGFEDEKGNYLGIIAVGFEIEKLKNYVINKIYNNNITFVIIDLEGNIIFQSADNVFSREDVFFKKNFNKKIEDFKELTGDLNIKINNISFAHYQLIKNYNYLILTGYNNKFIFKKFYNQVINIILFFTFVTFCFLSILYLFKIRIFRILNEEKNLARSLRISNTSKSNLIRATSHDLKNYLYSISGITKLLLQEKTLSKENFELLKLIDEQSDELALFLEDLLDINQQGEDSLDYITFSKNNVNDILKRIILLNKSLALKYNITIKENFSEEPVMLECDLRRMKQIFNNLVNNSIKYSPNETIIKIITKSINNKIIIEIIDQGIGMTKKEIALALEGKYQLIDKTQLNRNNNSYGIGLKNVQDLIKINNGILEIESKKNHGSIFRIIFNTSQHVLTKNNKNSSQKITINNFNKTILIVDDNPVNIKITSTVLQRAGYKVKTSHNGIKALEILDNENIDLILMDGEMPELNGYQTTIKIRKGKSFKKFKNFKTIPIIGLMGNNDEETIKECYNSGMNNHISKTKSTKEILDTIANFFTKN